MILANPRIKLVVIKILKNLVKLALPHEMFEEAVSNILKDSKFTYAHSIINRAKSQVFENSNFLSFLFNYLKELRSKIWHKNGLESEGTYSVSVEIINLL